MDYEPNAMLRAGSARAADMPPRLIDQAIGRADEIIGLLDQTQNALGSICERNLGGSQDSQTTGAKGLSPVRAGVTGHLLDRLDILHARAVDALEMAQRLDNRL